MIAVEVGGTILFTAATLLNWVWKLVASKVHGLGQCRKELRVFVGEGGGSNRTMK